MPSFSVSVGVLVFIFFYASPMTAQQQGVADYDAGSVFEEQISNSQLSIATVLGLFLCIGVMVADRRVSHKHTNACNSLALCRRPRY